jgi:hypothetical protein
VEVKKDIGEWMDTRYDSFTKHHLTELDDVAYYVYCQPRKNRRKENIATQRAFLLHPKVYSRFYDEAILLIRKEKIEKIKNGSK